MSATLREALAARVRADLRLSRETLGLSTRDVGKIVGVSGPTISRWETGDAQPPLSQLVAWGLAVRRQITTAATLGRSAVVVELADEAERPERTAATPTGGRYTPRRGKRRPS